MKSGWQKYLLYGSIVIVGGFIIFETVRLKNTGFEGKSLWDWMELLIIPAVLASGAYYLNRSERNTEREIAADRQKEAALQSYLDRMADLLLKEKLQGTKNKEVRNVARIRTLTILRGLDSYRKGIVIKFLYEAGLIRTPKPIINLDSANLEFVELREANLVGVNLAGAILYEATLAGANLEGANLAGGILYSANLVYADLSAVNLGNANLVRANLTRANLNKANLEYANLINAKLESADLEDANLMASRMGYANLRRARVSSGQLATVASLSDATMPDGTRHE